MKIIIVLFISLFSIFSFAQEKKTFLLSSDTTIYQEVDSSASYFGGMGEMMKYLVTNVVYPKEIYDNPRQGILYVKFVVEKDGRITNVESVKIKNHSTNLDVLFVKENRSVLSNMSKWKPAVLNGKAVRSYYTLPFRICVGR